MEVKKIVEGMTAVEVAEVIDDNFKGLNEEKANKIETDAKLSELGSKVNVISILGNDNNSVRKTFKGVVGGRRYKVQIKNPCWDVSNITLDTSYMALELCWTYPDGENKMAVQLTLGQINSMNDYYIVDAPEDLSEGGVLSVFMRANKGIECTFIVNDIFDFSTLTKYAIYPYYEKNRKISSTGTSQFYFDSVLTSSIAVEIIGAKETDTFSIVGGGKSIVSGVKAVGYNEFNFDTEKEITDIRLYPSDSSKRDVTVKVYVGKLLNIQKTMMDNDVNTTFNVDHVFSNKYETPSDGSSIYVFEGLKLYKGKKYTFKFTPDEDVVNSAGTSSTSKGYISLKVTDSNKSTIFADYITSTKGGETFTTSFIPDEDVVGACVGHYATSVNQVNAILEIGADIEPMVKEEFAAISNRIDGLDSRFPIDIFGSTFVSGNGKSVYSIEGVNLYKGKKYAFTFEILDDDIIVDSNGYVTLKVTTSENQTIKTFGYFYGGEVGTKRTYYYEPEVDYIGAKIGHYLSNVTSVNSVIKSRVYVSHKEIDDGVYMDETEMLKRDNVTYNSDFNALFFSDIHANTTALRRIINLGNKWGNNVIDAIIDGGDDTKGNINSTPLASFNDLLQNSTIPILRAVGNHDAWIDDNWTWADNQLIYDTYTSITISNLKNLGVNVVQPEGVESNHYNYYYCDFGNVRVIALLSLFVPWDTQFDNYYDDKQNQWFVETLNDALNNKKAVIVVNHAPINPFNSEEIKSNWTSWRSWTGLKVNDYQSLNNNAVNAVDDYISNGGSFVCWLTGHTHTDFLLKSKNSKNTQLCFTTSCARNGVSDGMQPSDTTNRYYDLFNMIGVDLENNILKVYRIGYNTNSALQEHNTFSWDYKNGVLLGES